MSIMVGDEEPTFIGCENAVALADTTCPNCGRKGKVPVSTDAIIHKTMLCTDCTEKMDQQRQLFQDVLKRKRQS